MFIDARELPEGHSAEADVCVIGAGAAGIAMAAELAGTNLRVCILESGGFESADEIQSLYDGTVSGLRYTPLRAARVRYFGGTTNHWSGWCRPLDPIDFERRPWVPYSGWPFGFDELEPYYDRAKPLFELDDSGFEADSPAHRWRSTFGFDSDRVATSIFRLTAPARFGDLYRERLANAGNVSVYLHANVTTIVPDDSVRTVRHLVARCLQGNRFAVRSRAYVLAAGGIENARLLLASNGVQKEGLGNGNDLVGRFFMDHPGVTAGMILVADPGKDLTLYTGEDREVSLAAKIDGGSMQKFLSDEDRRVVLDWIAGGGGRAGYDENIEPILRRRCISCHNPQGIAFHRTLQTYEEVMRVAIPAARDDDRNGVERVLGGLSASRRVLTKRHMQNYCMLLEEARGWSEVLAGDGFVESVSRIARNFPGASMAYYRKLFDEKSRRQLLRVVNVLEPSPNPDSRVTLTADRDALGMSRVNLDWRLNCIDRETICAAHDLLAAELGRTGQGRMLRTFDGEMCSWTDDLTHGWHHMGTTRMHDDRRLGVVDRNCQVHGIDNLFVAGSSVFPTYGYAQPTFTIVALALRLSDHLVSRVAASGRPSE